MAQDRNTTICAEIETFDDLDAMDLLRDIPSDEIREFIEQSNGADIEVWQKHLFDDMRDHFETEYVRDEVDINERA